MKKSIAALLCLLLCLASLGGCVTEDPMPTQPETGTNATANLTPIPAPAQQFAAPAEGADDFAFRLSRALLQNAGKGNFVSSPLSVWLPLAALVNGTDAAHMPALLDALGAAGFTGQDINAAAALLLRGAGERNNPLQIANAIFVGKDQKLNKNFKRIFEESFQGSAQSVDFASPSAVKTVNNWARKHTDGLIKEIIQEFDPDTVAAIANAIYFSDRWSWEFNADLTEKDTFHGAQGETQAFFMLREGEGQPYYEDGRLQATSLEFMTGGALHILLPKDGDAVALLSGMTADDFVGIRENTARAKGKLLLPRFKLDSGVMKLIPALRALGVPLFDAGDAALNGVLENSFPLYISEAVQKAVIEVDEKGTTAAAVTVMDMKAGSMPPPPAAETFTMVCDKPFVFVLCGGNGQILFTGVVNQI